MPTLNIVTAATRTENLPFILSQMGDARSVPDLKVRWLLIFDKPFAGSDGLVSQGATIGVEVVLLPWSGGPCKFGIDQKNHGLNHCERGFFHLLDDDNKVHPRFLERLGELIKENADKQAFAFNQMRWDHHGLLKPRPDAMIPGKIDNTMFVVHTDLIAAKRYDIRNAGWEDGFFFSELHSQAPDKWLFVDEILVFYNYIRHFGKKGHPGKRPTIDVFVVAYRSEQALPRLLEDLKEMSWLAPRIQVADNTGNPFTLTRLWNDLWLGSAADYVAILNPDIAISPGWDQHLYECLSSRSDVAVSMPNRYFPCNGYYDRQWMTMQASLTGAQASTKDLGFALEGFYAFMVKRSTLEALKGFDERFRFYYADSDFQSRALRIMKMQTTTVHHCPIGHFGSASTVDAERRGEIDSAAEKSHADKTCTSLNRGELKVWHELTDQDRQAVRNNPLYCRLSGKTKEVHSPMKLVIENIYSDEGRRKLTEAYVKSQWSAKVFHNSRWLGHEILQIPEDILAISGLIWTLRPKLIVECGIWSGGGLLLYASILELIKQGEVLGVDPHAPQAWGVKSHPLAGRIDFLRGSSTAPETIAAVKVKVTAAGDTLFILDSVHTAAHVREELEAYSPLVKSGGYIVVMDGIMNILHDVPGGSPSWRTDNPETAIKGFLADHQEFKRDPSYNIYGATWAPGGFLRRS